LACNKNLTATLLRVAPLILAITFAVSTAQAQKAVAPAAQSATVPLANLLALAKPYPNLRQEIRLARIATNTKPEAAACTARRLGTEWAFLAGQTLGPYRCKLGARMLDVTTATTFFDGAKHKLARDAQNLPSKAKSLTETRLVWRWL
jgi:hypothetical protein